MISPTHDRNFESPRERGEPVAKKVTLDRVYVRLRESTIKLFPKITGAIIKPAPESPKNGEGHIVGKKLRTSVNFDEIQEELDELEMFATRVESIASVNEMLKGCFSEAERENSNTRGAQVKTALNLFGLDHTEENSAVLQKFFPLEKANIIASYARKFPFMGEMIRQTSIGKDLAYLGILSDVLRDIIKDDSASEIGLYQLTLADLENVYPKDQEDLKFALLKAIQKQKPKPTSDHTTQRESPVTKEAIRGQASLQQVIRRGRRIAEKQGVLAPQGRSVNRVYKLGKAAYVKLGAYGETAGATMEKLMWDIAVILGMESQFAPTGKIAVDPKDENLHILPMSSTNQKSKRAGIQRAQNGVTLSRYKGDPLAKEEICKALLTCYVFGMWDAHASNIIVTPNGKIKFFDNTRSFPHSNGFIDRGQGLVSSFRSALLDLPGAHEALTSDEKRRIAEQLLNYHANFKKLEQFLNSKQVKTQIESLPEGWFDQQLALSAMKERVDLMLTALGTETTTTFADLITKNNPDYKLAFVMTFLNQYVDKKLDAMATIADIVQGLHIYVGYHATDELIIKLAAKEYDIARLKEWCDDPELDLEAIIGKIDGSINKPESFEESKIWRKQATHIVRELMSKAKIDYKDYDRGYIEDLKKKLIR